MSFYGLHASDKFAHQTGAQAAGLPQALWYFRNEWIAVPAGEPSAVVAARVQAARERALMRQGTPNAALDGAKEASSE